jgi:hypothetical protein
MCVCVSSARYGDGDEYGDDGDDSDADSAVVNVGDDDFDAVVNDASKDVMIEVGRSQKRRWPCFVCDRLVGAGALFCVCMCAVPPEPAFRSSSR